jgi:hypothetical protein
MEGLSATRRSLFFVTISLGVRSIVSDDSDSIFNYFGNVNISEVCDWRSE